MNIICKINYIENRRRISHKGNPFNLQIKFIINFLFFQFVLWIIQAYVMRIVDQAQTVGVPPDIH